MWSKRVLNEMARDMIGDGQEPNLFFLSYDNGTTFAVFEGHKDQAISMAEKQGAAVLEDRQNGLVWSHENGEEQ